MEQRSKEWFEARKGRINDSSVGAILGINPWSSRDDVMRRMVREYWDQPSEFRGNIAIEYGTRNEPNALEDYMLETGNNVKEVGFILYSDWIAVNPDGLIGDDGLVKIKCPYGMRDNKDDNAFKSISDQPHYYAQIQIQLMCTGRLWCDFYQWSPYASKIERVNIDIPWLEENVDKLLAFYGDYLVEKESENAWRYIDGGEIVYNYKKAKAALEVAKQELDEATDDLINAVGDEGGQIGDLKVSRVERKGSISYAKAIKDICPDADLEKYRGKTTGYWKVS